jgi:hypothetical protein
MEINKAQFNQLLVGDQDVRGFSKADLEQIANACWNGEFYIVDGQKITPIDRDYTRFTVN